MESSDERVVMDCRKLPSEKNCSVTISGRKDEVLPLAICHAVNDHGHEDTDELHDEIEQALEPEAA